MLTHSFNPQEEQKALSSAITGFQQRWPQQHTMEAVFDLADAIERAEEVYAELRQSTLAPQSDLAWIAINLQLLLYIARQELACARDAVLDAIGHQIVAEDRPVPPVPMLPAGTIVSCPNCGEGLYKVTTRASVEDIVLDDGTLLQPLNAMIPRRDAWRALACPQCGGRYHKDGKLHTLQMGWA